MGIAIGALDNDPQAAGQTRLTVFGAVRRVCAVATAASREPTGIRFEHGPSARIAVCVAISSGFRPVVTTAAGAAWTTLAAATRFAAKTNVAGQQVSFGQHQ